MACLEEQNIAYLYAKGWRKDQAWSSDLKCQSHKRIIDLSKNVWKANTCLHTVPCYGEFSGKHTGNLNHPLYTIKYDVSRG